MARTREQIRNARSRLRAEYGDLFDAIAAALFRADPIGISSENNLDEYEPEAETILPRLKGCNNVEEVVGAVHEEFVRWFSPHDAGPAERYKDAASEIWRLWNDRRESRS
jgi:hypothetical protein